MAAAADSGSFPDPIIQRSADPAAELGLGEIDLAQFPKSVGAMERLWDIHSQRVWGTPGRVPAHLMREAITSSLSVVPAGYDADTTIAEAVHTTNDQRTPRLWKDTVPREIVRVLEWPIPRSGRPEEANTHLPYSRSELASVFAKNAVAIAQAADRADGAAQAPYREVAASLDQLATEAAAGEVDDLESLEQRLTVLENKMIAIAAQAASGEQLARIRAKAREQLGPYRSKMSREQLALLEKQVLQRQILEEAGLPRLSLFCL